MNNYRRTLACLTPLLVAAAVGLTGCGGGSSIAQPKPLTELPNPGFKMQVLWHADGGSGGGKYDSGFVPAVAGGVVYVANLDGEVVALNLSNGHRIWDVDTDEQLISGPAVVDGTLLVGTRNGEIIALSADDGSKVWSADLSSEVIAAPAGTAEVAVARTVDGHVAALDMASGDHLWTIEGSVPNLTMRGTASPVIRGDTVYVGMDSGKVQALDLATGEQRWVQTVALPEGRSELDRIVDVDANPLIDGNVLYAISAGGSLVAMNENGGQIRWKHEVASENNLAVDSANVYATDMDSVVWGVSRATGDTVWKQDALKYRKLSAPAVVDGHVLVGDYEGYLHWLSPSDGSIDGRGHPFGEAIRAQPVVVGDRAIVLGADGEVAAVRFTPGRG
ncbi:outer membrane protein assembly factor BamB [Salinisphaera sp.]|uniref:outer membrane protein assembly factor BamB n=1 Tax=Salinisphaera sp. TaxID=1914330 RepID=UPI002D7859DB|nr:outer membrane protein assembly factor BamB [Salinisphaera sp.]HET7314673.1 outer membrane protein assembly factor BamB [Salinisphaera sp.]